MNIEVNNNMSINFKGFALPKINEKVAVQLLRKYNLATLEKESAQLKSDIFEIFNPYLQKIETKPHVAKDDFLQIVYLEFFKMLDKFKAKKIQYVKYILK